jgi:hypothetical protein
LHSEGGCDRYIGANGSFTGNFRNDSGWQELGEALQKRRIFCR